jgi:hypothetical protein
MKRFIGDLTVFAKVNTTLGDAAACIIVDAHRYIETCDERNCQKEISKKTEAMYAAP